MQFWRNHKLPVPLRPSQAEKGANLVEFAIIAPLLFLLLFGVVEVSRAIISYTTVWNGAREGARTATTLESYDDCNAIRAAAASMSVMVDIDPDADVEIRYFDPNGSPAAICVVGTQEPVTAVPGDAVSSGYTVEVSVSGSFNSVVPLLSVFFDGLALDSSQQRVIHVSEEVIG